jgi:Mor family transcriptional regulator
MSGRLNKSEDAIEMLPGDLKRIAEVAGLEAAVRLARAFRGSFLYVPGLSEVARKARDQMIKRDYDSGLSVRRISAKYDLSERWIWKILNSSSAKELPQEILNLLCEPED